MAPTTVVPEAFTRAVAGLRAATPREEILLEEIGAPQRLAPYAFALSATVLHDGDDSTTGRLILLHDPAGHEVSPQWCRAERLSGRRSVVRGRAYVACGCDARLVSDPSVASGQLAGTAR